MTEEFSLFNGAADRNKEVILEALQSLFKEGSRILEIGAGSGQHAVYFSAAMPAWQWQPSDREPYIEALTDNVLRLGSDNLAAPVYLDLADPPACETVDAVYCANVVHIMPAALISNLFEFAATVLGGGGLLVLYGPYKYNGDFTTESNAKFDLWLKEQHPLSGIRDIETMIEAAGVHGFNLIEDKSMPANNQLLVFERDHRQE